jgi:8-oxo-dGTP pyrophosphatase MutT (NUDIX family)
MVYDRGAGLDVATRGVGIALAMRAPHGITPDCHRDVRSMSTMTAEQRGDWTVLGSGVLYSNPWIAVREDQVIQPDGKRGAFGVVEMTRGISVLPVDNEGNVYLVRVFRYTLDRESLEAIAGGIEEGESAADAARRELKEEAGIEADELLDLGVVDQLTEVVVSPDHLFVARGLSFGTTDLDATEAMTRVKAPLEEAVAWALDGAITHAASALLVLKAAHLLRG